MMGGYYLVGGDVWLDRGGLWVKAMFRKVDGSTTKENFHP